VCVWLVIAVWHPKDPKVYPLLERSPLVKQRPADGHEPNPRPLIVSRTPALSRGSTYAPDGRMSRSPSTDPLTPIPVQGSTKNVIPVLLTVIIVLITTTIAKFTVTVFPKKDPTQPTVLGPLKYPLGEGTAPRRHNLSGEGNAF